VNRHILYIINPISGTSDKGKVKQVIEEATKAAAITYSIYPSVASGDYSFLKPVIHEEHVTDVVIAGGDGTLNAVVNELRNEPVQFGIIPLGSGNGLAFSAEIPKNVTAALEIIFKGNSRLTDAFTINGRFACMLCGLGFDAEVAHDFAHDPNRGLTTYIKKTISHFITATTHPFEIETEGEKFHTDAYFICIANSNQFGNHFTIAPQASLTDGLLDIVIVTKQNKLSLLLQVLRQVTGYVDLQEVKVINKEAAVVYFQTEKVKVLNPGLAPLHIDGEPVETGEEFSFTVLKQAFKLIYP
jgi:YegS/Rv2252/BmrU family lipid kinase